MTNPCAVEVSVGEGGVIDVTGTSLADLVDDSEGDPRVTETMRRLVNRSDDGESYAAFGSVIPGSEDSA